MVAMGSSSLSALAAATLLVSVAAEAIPTVTLPGYGNKMPLVSLGTGGFDIAQARNVTELALVQAGYRAIDTAHDYGCQKGVGAALIAAAKKGVPRDSVFLTTKIPGCTVPAPFEPCHEANDWAATKALIAADLKMLKTPYVDLLLIHFPPILGCHLPADCEIIRGQWAALEGAVRAQQAKAIGVSNYCPACMKCLLQNATMKPALNQLQYHVGMGEDPQGIRSYLHGEGILLEAYSPLSALPSHGDYPLTQAIGKAHNVSGVQVALKWVAQRQIPLATKATRLDYLREDIDLWSWGDLSAKEMATLTAASTPESSPFLFPCKNLSSSAH